MFAAKRLPYHKTNSFSKIVLDYLQQETLLSQFYSFAPTLEGIKKAITQKQNQKIDRQTLVNTLKDQYRLVDNNDNVSKNLDLLLSSKTFTICTAHQPNLFTGPLYFIYKILHAVKLADYLKKEIPENNFVPVFYMGCEDADLEELNHFTVDGKKYVWDTDQQGAVGRMIIDRKLLMLIDELYHQIAIESFGNDFIQTLKECFKEGELIQNATFKLIHNLFADYGLIVLIPDHADLKKQMLHVFEDDLFKQSPSKVVNLTCQKLGVHYPVQAHPRAINLFYLKDDVRERIEKRENKFYVLNTELSFTEAELKNELHQYPERFSPNVILRGLLQESILPNIVFIGGGGELAYWLQLKDLFQEYQIVFPVLMLRNSFLLITKKWQQKIEHLKLDLTDVFCTEDEIMKVLVQKNSEKKISLNGDFENASAFYDQIIRQAMEVDPSLSEHAAAIKTKSLKQLKVLEQKMLRSEKRKFTDQKRQVQHIKSALFPGNGLQERTENISSYYAKWRKDFIKIIFENSPAIDAEFTVVQLNK